MPGEPGRAPPPTAVEVWPSVAPFGEADRISVSIIALAFLCSSAGSTFASPGGNNHTWPPTAQTTGLDQVSGPGDRRPFVGARHPLRPHFARSSSAGHRWPAARDTSWLTLITSSGRHIMRRSVRQAPSAASTRPPRRTADLARAFCRFITPPAFLPPGFPRQDSDRVLDIYAVHGVSGRHSPARTRAGGPALTGCGAGADPQPEQLLVDQDIPVRVGEHNPAPLHRGRYRSLPGLPTDLDDSGLPHSAPPAGPTREARGVKPLMRAAFSGVSEGTRTPDTQDHNLVL